jgi:lipoyl(octanoyl) transferase
MALDEAILEAIGQERVPPTLRLYAWEPPCLSLGYAQSINDVDLVRLTNLGWDIVRRPTGGRAILHTDELTYSIIGPLSEPHLSGSVLESYQRLSQALVMALNLIGIPAVADAHPNQLQGSDLKGPICFEVPSNYEITVNEKKIIGSAQARKQGVLLQHGTLPLYGDLTRIIQVLSFADESQRMSAAERLLKHATTVEEILGRVMPWESAAQVFIQAFEKTQNLKLEQSGLTEGEAARADELTVVKYGHDSWTART